ncbi:LCP family protein [Pseudarthrobacter sp. N5]|uniref:LCP family protein n=1 Tax=Pseudarthrobacter sp. N5 TaxID=3418416 RepID=UPI003CE7CA9F
MGNQPETGGGADQQPAVPPGRNVETGRRRRMLIAILAAVLVAAMGTAAYLVNLAGSGAARGVSIETAPAVVTPTPSETAAPDPTPTPTPDPPPVAMNILLIGSDSRGNARDEAAQAAATGGTADQRADAIILVHVPADRQRIYGISIMRDLWVDIPGYGASKINAGLETGGTPLVVQTVETLLNTHIDHTVMMDFEGFKGLADALGGVPVDVRLPFTSTHDSQHDFPAGVNNLNGAQALEFVRERYAFADGDYQRVRNQQSYLRAVAAKLLSSGTLSEPATALKVVMSLLPYLTTDPGLDLMGIARLGFSLRGLSPEAMTFFTLPTAGTGMTTDGQSIVLPDYAGIAEVSAALAQGKLGEYAAANP